MEVTDLRTNLLGLSVQSMRDEDVLAIEFGVTTRTSYATLYTGNWCFNGTYQNQMRECLVLDVLDLECGIKVICSVSGICGYDMDEREGTE